MDVRIALNAAISWTRKQDRHQRGKQPLEIVDGFLAASAAEADLRVELIALAAGLICAMAVFIGQFRIAHVPVPYSESGWPFPLAIVLCFAFVFVVSLKGWAPRWQPDRLARKRQLEALLKELDDQ